MLLLTEWREYRDLDPVATADLVASPRIIDGRTVLDPRGLEGGRLGVPSARSARFRGAGSAPESRILRGSGELRRGHHPRSRAVPLGSARARLSVLAMTVENAEQAFRES